MHDILLIVMPRLKVGDQYGHAVLRNELAILMKASNECRAGHAVSLNSETALGHMPSSR